MMKENRLVELLQEKQQGIPSFCTANETVLEAVMKYAKYYQRKVLIEATANQVNQFGGYTGMQPADFRKMIEVIAKRTGVETDKIILGGDHLGPLTWKNLSETEAMKNAEELVREYVAAGFTKIHLDTSMKVGDDSEGLLSTEVIAQRGARLCRVAEAAFEELQKRNPEAEHPVYVIGSEVPTPGGTQEQEDSVAVTKSEDFRNTVEIYQSIFLSCGLERAWDYVIAVVVQPGVEFGDFGVLNYNRKEAKELTGSLKKYPELVFEGHSTDYQNKRALKEMVEDGIKILKVGPALTFSLREALFALSMIEKELLPEEDRSYFQEILEREMLENPQNWKPYYHGNLQTQKIARRYSYSDRIRYYLTCEKVKAAINKLFSNLEGVKVPESMIHQYMPEVYKNTYFNNHEHTVENMVESIVINVLLDYDYAAYGNVVS